MKKSFRKAAFAGLALAGAFALAACSSGGGRPDAASTSGGNAGTANTPKITVALITHAAAGDTFWDIVRKGAEDAAAKDNVNLVYSGDADGGRQAQLVQQAIDQKVDGIAVTLAKPDALQSVVEKATAAGIPVVALNAGSEQAFQMGATAYFGQEELIAGEAAGDRLAQDGVKHPICMIQEQGHVGLEARCQGIKNKVPGTEILYVTGTDMTQVTSTLTAKLQSTPDADAVMGLGAPFTVAAVGVVEQTGSKARVGSFDMNPELAQMIVDGKVEFTVDQQPYLQGYLSVDSLWLNKNGGFKLGGGQPVLTGPSIVDKTNAAAVLDSAKQGIR